MVQENKTVPGKLVSKQTVSSKLLAPITPSADNSGDGSLDRS
jgi:hypothetical protein